MSRCTISGNVGQDPEMSFTPAGKGYTKFSVATSGGKDKEGKEQTTWIRVTVWGEKAEVVNRKVVSGMHVICHGWLKVPEVYESKKHGDMRANIEMTAFEVTEAVYIEKELEEAVAE